MGYHIATRDDSLEKIAQIMSERSGHRVTSKDVKRELNTATTEIFSAVVHDRRKDLLSPSTSIICTVRKRDRKENQYEVTVERLN